MILTVDWDESGFHVKNRRTKVMETIDEAKKNLGETGSFSILMFFTNGKPLRIRSNITSSIGTGDRTLEAIDEWCLNGRGSMIIKTSTRHHMNDIFPTKSIKEFTDYGGDLSEEIFFHYYTGKYGNQHLWNAVSNSRNRGRKIGDAIKDYFITYDLQTIMDDIVVNDEGDDEYTYRDFEYSVYDSRGQCILQVGRNEVDGEYEHVTPRGCNFIGGYDDIQ